MEWLIKILGGYTAEQYDELKKICNDNAKICEDLKKEINDLKAKNHDLTDDCFELTNENKKLKAQLTADKEEVEEPKKWYYMYRRFKVYNEFGVQYINIHDMKNNSSFRVVYNRIWSLDSNKKVTPKEFNDEFTKLYNNRFNRDIVDEYLFNQLIQVEYDCDSMEFGEDVKYAYNGLGEICYKKSMEPVHK